MEGDTTDRIQEFYDLLIRYLDACDKDLSTSEEPYERRCLESMQLMLEEIQDSFFHMFKNDIYSR